MAQSGDFVGAVGLINKALKENPEDINTINECGLACIGLNLLEAASECFKKCIEFTGGEDPGFHSSYGISLAMQCRLKEAAEAFQRGIDCGGGPQLHVARGAALLGLGQWKEGFLEDAHRWDVGAADGPYMQYPLKEPLARKNYPQWKGEDLAGKHLLLYPEGGYGDEIRSIRFLDLVIARHPWGKITLQTTKPLVRLFRNNIGPSIKIIEISDEIDHAAGLGIDLSCSLLDVPMVLEYYAID